LKLKILTDIKIRFKKKLAFVINPVVFAPGTQTLGTWSKTYATELKKWDNRENAKLQMAAQIL
jgi:uncharacterized membrane protein